MERHNLLPLLLSLALVVVSAASLRCDDGGGTEPDADVDAAPDGDGDVDGDGDCDGDGDIDADADADTDVDVDGDVDVDADTDSDADSDSEDPLDIAVPWVEGLVIDGDLGGWLRSGCRRLDSRIGTIKIPVKS